MFQAVGIAGLRGVGAAGGRRAKERTTCFFCVRSIFVYSFVHSANIH